MRLGLGQTGRRLIWAAAVWCLVFSAPWARVRAAPAGRAARAAQQSIVRVGVFNFDPLVFMDAGGVPRGLYIDMLEAVAAQENWRLVYIPGSFSDLLAELSAGQIDLLPAIAYSDERAQSLDFSTEYLFLDWGVVYVPEASPVRTVVDLAGKRVGVIKGVIYSERMLEMLNTFDVHCQLVEFNDGRASLSALAAGQIDASVMAQSAGLRLAAKFPTLDATSIVFAPTKLRFAAPRGRNAALLQALDQRLAFAKADPKSGYLERLSYWTSVDTGARQLREWGPWAIGLGGGMLALAIAFLLILRRQVDQRTFQLAQANEDARRARDYLDQLIQFANAPIIVWDAALRITRFNAAFERLTGHAATEVVGRHLSLLFPYTSRQESLTQIQRALGGERLEALEIPIQRQDGQVRLALWNSANIYTADGAALLATIAQGVDITDRQQALAELRESERRYRLLAENMADVVWILDPASWRFRYISQSVERLRGYTVEEALRQPLDQVLAPDGLAYLRASLPERLARFQAGDASAITHLDELRQSRRDGRWIWTEVATTLARNDQGEIEMLGVTRDISDRKRVEIELRERQANLQRAQRIASVGSYEWDPDSGRVVCSDELHRILGLPREQFDGTLAALAALTHPADRRTVEQTDLGRPIEYRIVRPDGQVRWIRALSERVFEAGRLVKLIGANQDITESKQAEAALQQSEERYRALFEDSPISLWEQDFSAVRAWLDGLAAAGVADLAAHLQAHPEDVRACMALVKVTRVNKASLRLFRASSQAELLTGLERYVHADALAMFRQELVWIAHGRPAFELEGVNHRLDGVPMFIHLHWLAAPGHEANLDKVLISIQDITERRQAEQALLESQALLRQTLASLQEAVLLVEADSERILDCNPAAEAMFGFSRAELVGQPTVMLHVDAEAQASFLSLLRPAVAARGLLKDQEFRLRRRDGALFYSENSVTPLLDEAGRAAAWVRVIRDVTERKRSEAALARQTAELAALYRASAYLFTPGSDPAALAEQIAQAVVQEFALADCGVLLVDEARGELLRLARAGVFQVTTSAPLPLDGKGLSVTAIRQGQMVYAPDVAADPRYARNDSRTCSELAVPLRVGARVIGVLDLQSPMPDAFDERARHVLVAFAERAALALENARLLEQLGQSMLRSNRLAAAAEEASRMKSEFLANTSHELRTPLTGIIGSLSIVLEDLYDSPEEERQFLRVAYSSARNLLQIVNDLLDIAKIEAGKMEVLLQPLAVQASLTEVLALLQAQALEKGLKLEVDRATSGLPRVSADPDKLRQVLVNLVGNAIKFTKQGGVQVRARLVETGQVEIQVRDTGIGIALDKQRRLFQPFVQADGSTTRRYGGTGLGLSISRRLVELMGGQLTLESPGEGLGATFTVTLQAAPEPAE